MDRFLKWYSVTEMDDFAKSLTYNRPNGQLVSRIHEALNGERFLCANYLNNDL